MPTPLIRRAQATMKEMGFDEGAGGEAAEEGEGPAAAPPPKGPGQKYKAGDPALRLDVVHLNAFQAMEATMKEMGFEEGGQGEGSEGSGEGEEGEEGSEEGEESEEPSVTSPPDDPNHKYKAGDPALRLDVVHLNAFQAMEATMKEMGFEEGGQGEEGEEGGGGEGDQSDQGSEHAAEMAVVAPPPTGGGGSSKRAQVQPTSSRQPSRHVAFVPDPYRQEPPDFEPPPKQRCFQEEEEGAGRRTQIAAVAVRTPFLQRLSTCSASHAAPHARPPARLPARPPPTHTHTHTPPHPHCAIGGGGEHVLLWRSS